MILFSSNMRLATSAIRNNRWRSLLTMLGVIIGVAAVITTVSLGEGVKQQISNQITDLGGDLIVVRPGRSNVPETTGITATPQLLAPATGLLTDQDVQAVKGLEGVLYAVPMSLVSGLASYRDRDYQEATIIGTTHEFPSIMQQDVKFGEFFRENDEGRKFAAIGRGVAEDLFQENVPVGKSFDLRDERFVMKGVFDDFDNNLFIGADLNNTIFIPYITGRTITEGSTQVFQIFVQPTEGTDKDQLQADIEAAVLETRGGQTDFTVMQQEESLAATNDILTIVTALVSGVAAISLIVGGIGIMNIMLVSVSERTREIGIRKAVGATTRQITSQFLTEAILLSLIGGIIGVLLSLLLNFVIRVVTDLTPVISLPVIGIAVFVSLVVGVVFGVAPAFRAAHKDPIEALRHE